VMGAVVLAPACCGEFVYCGMLQRGLAAATTPRAAAVLSAFIFSAFHLDPVGFAARFELGLVFGLLFLRTNSLWPGILAHSANNLISTVLYFGFNGAQAADAELPSWRAVLAVALFGLVLLAGLLGLARTEPSVLQAARLAQSPVEAKPMQRGAAVRPWVLGALAMLAVVALADRRGLVLGWYDLAYHLPPLGKSATQQQKVDREKLEALRKAARAGKVPLEAYRALREELFRQSRQSADISG